MEEEGRLLAGLLLAGLLSGQQVDSTGNMVPLQASELVEGWRRLRAKYPGDFAAAPAEALAWHQREAEASEKAQQWFAAVFHLDRLIAAQPDDRPLRNRRTSAYAHLNQGNNSKTPDSAGASQ